MVCIYVKASGQPQAKGTCCSQSNSSHQYILPSTGSEPSLSWFSGLFMLLGNKRWQV